MSTEKTGVEVRALLCSRDYQPEDRQDGVRAARPECTQDGRPGHCRALPTILQPSKPTSQLSHSSFPRSTRGRKMSAHSRAALALWCVVTLLPVLSCTAERSEVERTSPSPSAHSWKPDRQGNEERRHTELEPSGSHPHSACGKCHIRHPGKMTLDRAVQQKKGVSSFEGRRNVDRRQPSPSEAGMRLLT